VTEALPVSADAEDDATVRVIDVVAVVGSVSVEDSVTRKVEERDADNVPVSVATISWTGNATNNGGTATSKGNSALRDEIDA
jgi:hypothetical protein